MLKLLRLHKNQRGFQHLIVPVVVIIAVAAIGTYTLAKSKAATAPFSSGLFGYPCISYPPPTIRQGNTGACVKVIQTGLNNYDAVANYFAHRTVVAPLAVDGNYGPNTTAAVRYFQSQHKLAADGVFGTYSWVAFLNSCVTMNGGNSVCFVSGSTN